MDRLNVQTSVCDTQFFGSQTLVLYSKAIRKREYLFIKYKVKVFDTKIIIQR